MKRLFELAKRECIIFAIAIVILESFAYLFFRKEMFSSITFFIVIEILVTVFLYVSLRISKIMKDENPKIAEFAKAYFKFGLFIAIICVPWMYYILQSVRK